MIYKYLSLTFLFLGLGTPLMSMEAPVPAGHPLNFNLKVINNSDTEMTVELTSYKGVRAAHRIGELATLTDMFLILTKYPSTLARAAKATFSEAYTVTLRPHASVTIEDLLSKETIHVSSPGLLSRIPGLRWTKVPLEEAYKLGKANAGSRRSVIIVVTPTRTGFNFETTLGTETPETKLEAGEQTIEEMPFEVVTEERERIK